MDPITQGALGANAAQLFRRQGVLGWAWFLGMLGGLLPDLDIIIRSSEDPFVALRYHRHFSHSLIVIPLGGFIVASLWFFRARFHSIRWHIYLAATAGFATHALLDSLTSYGTMLLWPFDDTRYAFDVISIIDLFFTLPLIFFVVWAQRKQKRRIALAGFLYCLIYIGFCFYQHERALEAQVQIADRRGHKIERGKAHPSLGNNILWRSIYEYKGRFYSDAIRVPWFGSAEFMPGGETEELKSLDLSEIEPEKRPVVREKLEFFRTFSDGWLGRDKSGPVIIGSRTYEYAADLRYSLLPHEMKGLWGIYLNPQYNGLPLRFKRREISDAKTGENFNILWRLINGEHRGLQALSE